MKYIKSRWKKFYLAAAFFLLGLLPYLASVVLDGSASGNPAAYARAFAVSAAGLAIRYFPHILTVYVLFIAILVFFEERNPDRTILWLMTLIFLPVVGIILYLLLGPDMKRVRMRKLFKPARAYPGAEDIDLGMLSEHAVKMSILAYRSSSAPICGRNSAELLTDGEKTFEAIKRELKRASRYINIEYYIFEDDRLGREISAILAERSRAGVKVRMTVDGVGSWKLGRELIGKLQGAGVLFHTFMPVSFPFFHSRLNYRNHRKIIVIDGEAAFTGGMNVGTEYLGEGPLGYWRDTHVLFRGEAVRALNEIFLSDWNISSGEKLSATDAEFSAPDGAHAPLPVVPLQIVPSGGSAWRSIRQMYFTMITGAQTRIWITTPYMIPGEAIQEALRTAALSGVDVRLLIPCESDHFLSHWASFSNIEDLLRAGVRIWLYKKGFLHAKTLVMDDEIASIGTANLDSRSLDINFEIQSFIYDEKICSRMSEHFLKDIEGSEECVLSNWESRGIRSKILESIGRLWSSQV
ncbi:MAG: cardiolipin synthase [Synergistaceae bacterium]|jgi:cardiolipin synthase|nr:cardiolipin synthase [Synergistaceae bacterium]